MDYRRMPIEIESPEQYGYENIECNLAESSVNDLPLGKLTTPDPSLLLSYGDHRGLPALRKILAEEYGVSPDSVLITAGAAAALFIVNTALLNAGDHALIFKPNYATNIETPRMLGCEVEFLDLVFEEKFELNTERLKKQIRPGTKLISITTPHNPTGMVISEKILREIISIAERSRISLLVDETYRDLRFLPPDSLAATLSSNAISVGSLSKAYGLPGLRIGWIVSQDTNLMEKFLAAKEQIFICNSVLDEDAAFSFLQKKNEYLPAIKSRVEENFSILKNWINSEKRVEWIEPTGGVVAFPKIKSSAETDTFYRLLNSRYKTFTGPGHWFGMDNHFMRIGYAWPDKNQLVKGLQNISKSLDESI